MKKYKVDDKFLNNNMNSYYTKKIKLKKDDIQWDKAFDYPKCVPSIYDNYEMLKNCQKEAEELRAKLQEAQEEILMLKEEIKDLNNLLDQV
jgi:hypothetical protein